MTHWQTYASGSFRTAWAGGSSFDPSCSEFKNGLPIGLQLITKPFAEETMFRIAYTYEQNTPWHKIKVKIKTS